MAGDWEWSDRRGVQELDWQEVEADLGKGEGRESQSNGDHWGHQILPTMEKLLEIRKIMHTKN